MTVGIRRPGIERPGPMPAAAPGLHVYLARQRRTLERRPAAEVLHRSPRAAEDHRDYRAPSTMPCTGAVPVRARHRKTVARRRPAYTEASLERFAPMGISTSAATFRSRMAVGDRGRHRPEEPDPLRRPGVATPTRPGHRWAAAEVDEGGRSGSWAARAYSSGEHVPVLIYPSPLNTARTSCSIQATVSRGRLQGDQRAGSTRG